MALAVQLGDGVGGMHSLLQFDIGIFQTEKGSNERLFILTRTYAHFRRNPLITWYFPLIVYIFVCFWLLFIHLWKEKVYV